MSEQNLILLCQKSVIEHPEVMAKKLHQWLIEKNIIIPETANKNFSENKYHFSEGFCQILSHSGLESQHQFTGFSFKIDRQAFDPGEDGGIRSISCPFCEHVIVGEPEITQENCIEYFDSQDELAYEWINSWLSENQNDFSCPACLKSADINQFLFIPQWGFSNFALVFENGYSGMFRQDFIDELAKQTGYGIVQVDCYS